tara:strand:+ start:81 stop:1235 length:1155 start_codon:yes stop_codon:yes gene_type:complete
MAEKEAVVNIGTLTKSGPNRLGTTLIYPLDLDGQTFYPESIKFTVCHRESASLEEVGRVFETAFMEQNWVKIYKAYRDNDEKQIAAFEKQKQEEEAERAAAGNVLENSFFSDMKTVVKNTKPALTKGLNQKHSNTVTRLETIYMNMPNEITFSEPVGWEGTDLGIWGGLTKEKESAITAGAVSNFGNMMGAGTGALGGLIAGAFKKLPGINMMTGGLLGLLGGQGLQKTMESGFGNIGNPYKEMTFSGIGFREFSFNFVFRARSFKEVETVKDIIETFRYYSKPKFLRGRSLLSYPEEFHIEFLTRNDINDQFDTNNYIPQIKMCVCKGVNTNFTSQNTWRALRDGAPVEISLGLQFEETELVTAEDVIGEGTQGRFGGTRGRF